MGTNPVVKPPEGYVLDEQLPPGFELDQAAPKGPPPAPPPGLTLSGDPEGPAPGIRAQTFWETPLVELMGHKSGLDWLREHSPTPGPVIPALEATTPLAMAEAAPGALATAGAMAATAATGGIAAPLAMAALGGAGGVGFKRLGQMAAQVPIMDQNAIGRALFPQGIPSSVMGDLTEMFGEGVKQATFEGLGLFMNKLLRTGAPADRVMALVEDLGLPTKPKFLPAKLARQTLVGGQMAAGALERGEAKALTEAGVQAEKLGTRPPIPEESPLRYIQETKTDFRTSMNEAERVFNQNLKKSAEEATARGMTEAEGEVQALLHKIAPEAVPSIEAGKAAQEAARAGVSLGKKEAERLYTAADTLNQSAMVDISDHVKLLEEMAEESKLAPTVDPGALVAYAKKLSETVPQLGEQAAFLKQLEASPGVDASKLVAAIRQAVGAKEGPVQIPYQQARDLQKWLGQRMSPKLSGNIGAGRLKRAWGSIADAVQAATEGTEGGVALKEANAAYRDFSDVAKRGAVPTLVEKFRSSPEDVLKVLSRGPSRVQQLRKAIVGYAERNGSLQDQAAANEAWDQTGRLFADQKILDGGVSKLPDRLAKVGDETLDALYGREVANNWRTIASSINSFKSTPGPEGVKLRPSAAQEAALKRLSDLDAALRLADRTNRQFSLGPYFWMKRAAELIPAGLVGFHSGLGAGAGVGLATEAAGGLITWVATNPIRLRLFMNAMAHRFRYNTPATLRLINSYLDYQRDMELVRARKEAGGAAAPGLPSTPPSPPPPAPPLGFSFLGQPPPQP